MDQQRALQMIEQRDERIKNQTASINRLLQQWQTLQEWLAEQCERGEENVSSEGNAAYNATLDKMTEIRERERERDQNG